MKKIKLIVKHQNKESFTAVIVGSRDDLMKSTAMIQKADGITVIGYLLQARVLDILGIRHGSEYHHRFKFSGCIAFISLVLLIAEFDICNHDTLKSTRKGHWTIVVYRYY